MILLITQYLLAGLIIAFFLEYLIRSTTNNVSGLERYALIVFWPIMIAIFIIYFIKGLFED